MKKLLLSVVVVMGTMATFATPVTPLKNSNGFEIMQEEYTEIANDAVPEAIKSTLKTSFPGAKLVKAYSKENKEYKLDIVMGDKSYTLFTDAEGKIIKK